MEDSTHFHEENKLLEKGEAMGGLGLPTFNKNVNIEKMGVVMRGVNTRNFSKLSKF